MYPRRLFHVSRLYSSVVPTYRLSTSAVYPYRQYYSRGHPECQPKPANPFFDPWHHDSIWGLRPRSLIGGKHLVTMVNGVGVGPELMEIVRRVFLCANAPISFDVLDMNENAEEDELENLIYSVERNGVAIKGHFGVGLKPEELMTRSFKMKRALDLCINLVEIKTYQTLVQKTRIKAHVDVVIICPNSEGVFALLEHDNGKGIENLRVTTEYNNKRMAEFAFQFAVKQKRRKVTLIHNKGIMNLAEGTIISAVSRVANNFPNVHFHKESITSFISNMSKCSFNGDIIITMPIYAGIVKNILFGMTQGSGLYCAQNIGPRYAVFEAASRNKGTKMVGKDVVNPLAVLDAGVKLLEYLNHHESADRIRKAVLETVITDRVHTRDMLGDSATSAVVANIEKRIRVNMPEGYRG